MYMKESDIVALDFIIDKILETKKRINYAPLVKEGLIPSLDDKKTALEFKRLLNIIKHVNCAKVIESDFSDTVDINENTNDFKNNGGFKTYFQEELNRFEKKEEIDTLALKKLRWDSKLSKWQVKTFWPVFGFGLIGFIFGVFNFVDNRNKTKSIEELQQDNQNIQEEVSRLHTLVLDKKTFDSLHSSKTQIDSLSPR